MSEHNAHAEASNPPLILYVSVLAAAATILYLLIHVAARPWGWPQGAVEEMHQTEAIHATGGHAGEGHGEAPADAGHAAPEHR